MTLELKQCPICNGICAVIDDTVFNNQCGFETPLLYCIRCNTCGLSSAWYSSATEAIHYWNNRTESTEIPQWFKERIKNQIKAYKHQTIRVRNGGFKMTSDPYPSSDYLYQDEINLLQWVLSLKTEEKL